MKKTIYATAIAAAAFAGLNMTGATSSFAATCYYGVYMDGEGMLGFDKNATAARRSVACRRAERRCNRMLKRLRQGKTINGYGLPRHSPRQIRCARYGK